MMDERLKSSSTDPGSSISGRPAAGRRRAPIRRDPEKRRQQNLQAAAKYRKKRREQIRELEILAASATPAVNAEGFLQQTPSQSPTSTAKDVSSLVVSDESNGIDNLPALSTPKGLSFDDLLFLEPSEWVTESPHSSHIEDHRCKTWQDVVFGCGCPLPHTQFRKPSTSSITITYSEQSMLTITREWTLLPDPRANHLNLGPLCLVEALRANCLQVGITHKMFCSEDSESPFYREGCEVEWPVVPDHDGSRIQDNNDIVPSVQSLFSSLKPDLRPLREQITASHHPYIDILPFPTIRRELIRCAATIDEDEFFHDLLSGAVCWGDSGTLGQQNRLAAGSGIGSGTPWDVRSWEASEWFLQKYWTIVGGDDGELTRQSRWWRSLRGENMADEVL